MNFAFTLSCLRRWSPTSISGGRGEVGGHARKGAVGGDERAVEFNGQGQERSVVKGEAKLRPNRRARLSNGVAGGATTKGSASRRSTASSNAAKPRRVLRSRMLPTSYRSKAGTCTSIGRRSISSQKLFGFFHKLFVTRLEPLDEDRSVNDDL